MLKFLLLLQLVYLSVGVELGERFAWKQLEIDSDPADPQKNIPHSFEVYKDRMFITMLKRDTNEVSLASVNITDPDLSQKIKAYPNFAAFQEGNDMIDNKIGFALRVHADRCDRLWVLDNGGKKKSLHSETSNTIYPPALIVFDLKTDKIIVKQNFDVKAVEFNEHSRFAIEDADCKDTYVYVENALKSDILVYSLAKKEHWPITSTKGVSMLGLAPNIGFSTLYFKSNDQVSYISTEKLHNKIDISYSLTNLQQQDQKFDAVFIDPITNVLYYSANSIINAEHCWTKLTKKVENIIIDNTFHAIDIRVESKDTSSSIYVLAIRNDHITTTDKKIKLFVGTDTVNSTECDMATNGSAAPPNPKNNSSEDNRSPAPLTPTNNSNDTSKTNNNATTPLAPSNNSNTTSNKPMVPTTQKISNTTENTIDNSTVLDSKKSAAAPAYTVYISSVICSVLATLLFS